MFSRTDGRAALLLVASLGTACPAALAADPPAAAPRTVLLRIVDRLDRPVPGVLARLLPEPAKLAVEAATDGLRVVLPAAAGEDGKARLRLEAAGFTPVEVKVPEPGAGSLPVRMKADGSVTASFVSLDEKREDSLLVTLAPVTSGPGAGPGKAIAERKLTLPPRPKVTKVVFEDVPSGFGARAWSGPNVANGTASATVAALPVDAGRQTLRRGITIVGAVRDDLGIPVAGAHVFVQERSSFDRSNAYYDETSTAADGGFSIPGAPSDEPLFWRVSAQGRMEGKGLLGGETRLEVVLERAQRVTGRLVDPDGAPVRDARVDVTYVSKTSTRGHAGTIGVAEDGAFSFFRQVPLQARVTVRAKAFRLATREMAPLAEAGWPKEADLGEIRLDRGRTLRGRVTDATTGGPVAGVALKTTAFRNEAGAATLEEQEAVSGEDGSFEITGVVVNERVTLYARKAGYAPRGVDVAETQEEVEVVLGQGGRVEGRLCGRAFELSRSEIWLSDSTPVQSRDGAQKPDASGRFVFTGVEPGRRLFTRAFVYEDPLRPGGGYAAMIGSTVAAVVVEEGRTSSVSLACDGLPLSGTLLREGRPVAGRVLAFNNPAEAEADGMTDEAGRFSLRIPAPGTWTPWIDDYPAPGMKWAPVSCEVPPGGLDGCLLDLRAVPVARTP